MIKRSAEPLLWMVFSAGGVVAALVLPMLLFLFAVAFPPDHLSVEAHGNVLSAIAFLHGLAAEELRPSELDYRDADYEMLITVRARKPESAEGERGDAP